MIPSGSASPPQPSSRHLKAGMVKVSWLNGGASGAIDADVMLKALV